MDDGLPVFYGRVTSLDLNSESVKETPYSGGHLYNNHYEVYSRDVQPQASPAQNAIKSADEGKEKLVAMLKEARAGTNEVPWTIGDYIGSGSFGVLYDVSCVQMFGTATFAARKVSVPSRDEVALVENVNRLSEFKHDNIVQYLGTTKVDGKLYILMERAARESLEAFCAKMKIPSSAISVYIRQTLKGLKYLHDHDILHGNIKCANILVGLNGMCKLADFGMSRLHLDPDLARRALGSTWIAPEVNDPKKASGLPSDIWSLGCSMIEMAIGDRLFALEIGLEMYRKSLHGKAPPIPHFLPETAKEFIQQCLRIDPLTRPTATELLQHPFVQPLGDKLPTQSDVVLPVEMDCVQAITREDYTYTDVCIDHREGGRVLEGAPKLEESYNETCERSADLSAHIKEIKIGDDEFKSRRIMEEPGGQLKNVSEQLTKVVKDFIIELKKGEEDGFFVSTMWLSNLEEHERVVFILMLRSLGYSEVYDTSTTILYERVDQDSNSPTMSHDESSTHTRNDVTLDTTEQATVSRVSSDDLEMTGVVEMENILPTFGYRHKQHHSDDIDEYGSSVQSRPTYAPGVYEYSGQPQVFEHSGSPPKQRLEDMDASRTESDGFSDSSSSRTGPFQDEILSVAVDVTRKANNDSCVTILKKEEKQPGNLVEQQSTTMETLMVALKEERLRSYFVSTEWLSNLDGHQKEIVKSICVENGYTKTYQTSSMTCIERSENLAHNICKYSDVSSMDAEIDSERNFGASEGGDEMLPGGYSDRMGMKKKIQKADSIQTCVGQLLEVTCRSSSESSTSTGPLTSSQNLHQRSVRRPCGDSLVTLPKQCKGYILPTKVDKVIPMTTIDFRGASEYVEVPISLKVNIETIVSCCLRDEDNPKKMRVKFSRIGGEVKNVQATEPNVNALVLKSIRANVVACVDRSDERDGYESINLNLEDEYSHSPHRRVLETLPVSVTGNQTKRVDRVWLALSGINPESDELGSITVELQCHVLRTCKAQLQGKINGAHVLLFKDPRPVTLEGDIYTSLGQESFFELDIRYQLEISYIEPCKPFPQEARPYLSGKRKTDVVDFDCILEYQARNLSLC